MAYTSVTRATLRLRLQERFESVPFWTDAEANRALNEALRVWNLLTGTWKARVSVPCVPSDPFVPLPGSITYGLRVLWQSTPLIPTTWRHLDAGRPSWQSELAGSTGVPSHPTLWAPVGLNLIVVWPVPTALADLAIDGLAATPVLSADGDFVNLGEEDLSNLLDYALHVLSFKEGGVRFAARQAGYQAFIRAAYERNSRLKDARFFRGLLGLDDRPGGARPRPSLPPPQEVPRGD